MRRFLLYVLIGIFFALLQSSVLPLFFVPNWRPNLILILVLFLSFHESLPLAVFGRTGLLRRLLANLADNAFRYTSGPNVAYQDH